MERVAERSSALFVKRMGKEVLRGIWIFCIFADYNGITSGKRE